MVCPMGFEPTTLGFRDRRYCLTELRAQNFPQIFRIFSQYLPLPKSLGRERGFSPLHSQAARALVGDTGFEPATQPD